MGDEVSISSAFHVIGDEIWFFRRPFTSASVTTHLASVTAHSASVTHINSIIFLIT